MVCWFPEISSAWDKNKPFEAGKHPMLIEIYLLFVKWYVWIICVHRQNGYSPSSDILTNVRRALLLVWLIVRVNKYGTVCYVLNQIFLCGQWKNILMIEIHDISWLLCTTGLVISIFQLKSHFSTCGKHWFVPITLVHTHSPIIFQLLRYASIWFFASSHNIV